MHNLYIGLMSGTSMDGVDAVLTEITDKQIKLVAHHHETIPEQLEQDLNAICQPGEDEINRLGRLDVQVGRLFAQATLNLLSHTDILATQVSAIGSHGQTIRHMPKALYPFSLQIGDPNIIATQTGITTVADFRRRDIALGGQGAPLVPAFHRFLFHDLKQNCIVLNLGGIANVSYLPADTTIPVIGFDTGPANTLLDQWIKRHKNYAYDKNGTWAASGKINFDLLEKLLSDHYFNLMPPKSTGREYFNLSWLDHYLLSYDSISAADVQATLCELTAISIANAIEQFIPHNQQLILVAGGGVKNNYLLERIKVNCHTQKVAVIEEYTHISSQSIEAAAFAWFAHQTLHHQPANLPSVTGARDFAVLGGIYYK